MASERILITPRSLTSARHPALEQLEQAGYQLVFCTPGRQPDEAELLRLLPGSVGYLAGVERVSARVLEAAPGLRAISRNGTGVDNIDLETASRLGIAVVPAEGANARGVAELTIGLMFALVRHVPFSDRALKAATWERRQGIEIAGRVLGLIGCGRVGQLVARMAASLGMRVVGCDPFRSPVLAQLAGFDYAELDAVLTEADVVSLHCPPPVEGRPLIDRERLAVMRPGAYLINTARGELLDDQAVLDALDSGKLAGVALDVFRREPPGADSLVQHERVIAVPHVGGYTEESVSRAVEMAVDNLLGALQGRGARNG